MTWWKLHLNYSAEYYPPEYLCAPPYSRWLPSNTRRVLTPMFAAIYHAGQMPADFHLSYEGFDAAKLPGAGISLKLCPGKCAAEKAYLPKSVGIRMRSRLWLGAKRKTVESAFSSGAARCYVWLAHSTVITTFPKRALLPDTG